MLPFLFITIACGAISGFHGLVSSGTTSKQIGCMTDARPIAYGGMLGEGTLALMAVMATTAGFTTRSEWLTHYESWGAAGSLPKKLEAFVNGGARFVSELGIPTEVAATFIAVMVVAFAATTLDTGARILRMLISELATSAGFRPLQNRYAAGALGIAAALLLAITQAGGQGGLALWPLFGTTNQLTAAATLLVVSLWLRSTKAPFIYTLVPAIFVGAVTLVAMTREVIGYASSGKPLLLAVGAVILALDLWVLFEGIRQFSKPVEAAEAST